LRAAAQTREQKETARTVEAGTGILGRVWGCCPVVWGGGQEGQGAAGAELGKGC